MSFGSAVLGDELIQSQDTGNNPHLKSILSLGKSFVDVQWPVARPSCPLPACNMVGEHIIKSFHKQQKCTTSGRYNAACKAASNSQCQKSVKHPDSVMAC
jgi:hypothetical protein